MGHQSTNHILMVAPAGFQSNPETLATNSFQKPQAESANAIQNAALAEFKAFRGCLKEHGVTVTTASGQQNAPDDVFCNNWVSIHADKGVLYPMMAASRRKERRGDIIKQLGTPNTQWVDLTAHEEEGKFLESTGSLVLDRVNNRAYAALSERTHPALLEQWGHLMGMEVVAFNTQSFDGTPIYHTNVLMFIGSGYVGICLECIAPQERDRVRKTLAQTHELIELEQSQLLHFCGNALEVRGHDNQLYLAMSSAAFKGLHRAQIKQIEAYTSGIIHSDLTTIETYGGGSARCMMLEVF